MKNKKKWPLKIKNTSPFYKKDSIFIVRKNNKETKNWEKTKRLQLLKQLEVL